MKKQERTGVKKFIEKAFACEVDAYHLKCGDAFMWPCDYPPTYCPYCGRIIDYSEKGEE